MAEEDHGQTDAIEHAAPRHGIANDVFVAPMQHIDELQQAEHVKLSWRSWMVVFVTCFAIMAQVYVVVAAGSVIAFIIRDLGEAPIAGWIIRKCPTGSSDSSFVLTGLGRGTTAHAKCLVSHRR